MKEGRRLGFERPALRFALASTLAFCGLPVARGDDAMAAGRFSVMVSLQRQCTVSAAAAAVTVNCTGAVPIRVTLGQEAIGRTKVWRDTRATEVGHAATILSDKLMVHGHSDAVVATITF